MTVKELYEQAKAMMFEKKSSKDYDGYYKPYINILLSENFDLNNNLRLSKGLAALTTRPTISADTETLPYEDELNSEVLPKGLAMYFYIDDDLQKFNIFNTQYLNAQMMYQKGIETAVADAYASSDD